MGQIGMACVAFKVRMGEGSKERRGRYDAPFSKAHLGELYRGVLSPQVGIVEPLIDIFHRNVYSSGG